MNKATLHFWDKTGSLCRRFKRNVLPVAPYEACAKCLKEKVGRINASIKGPWQSPSKHEVIITPKARFQILRFSYMGGLNEQERTE